MLTALPSGDDLGIVLFFIAAGVTGLIAATQEDEWRAKRWLFISAAAGFFLCGLFWPTIKVVSPALNSAAISLSHNAFFHFFAGGCIGLALGLWCASSVSRHAAPIVPLIANAVTQISKISEITLSEVPTPVSLRLQFHGPENPMPTMLSETNVLTWRIFWGANAEFSFQDKNSELVSGFRIPKTFVLYILFDKPTKMK